MDRNYSTEELLLHIPHSSTVIPERFRQEFLLDEPGLRRELLRMTDLYTDELFFYEKLPPENRFVFPYSRLLCDVERFRDDAEELMASRGMGVCYTRTLDGEALREVSEADREAILKLYDAHHRALTEEVDRVLEQYGRCILLDCHSFSSRQLPYELPPERMPGKVGKPRPDICIGRDFNLHTPEWLAQYLMRAFTERGYRVEYDRPFNGTLIPMKHYHRDLRVRGAMIELNRSLYMDEETGEKRESFFRVRKDIRKVIEGLRFLPPEMRREKRVPMAGQQCIAYTSEAELKEVLEYLTAQGYENVHGVTVRNQKDAWPKVICVAAGCFYPVNVTCMAGYSAAGRRACTLWEFRTVYENAVRENSSRT